MQQPSTSEPSTLQRLRSALQEGIGSRLLVDVQSLRPDQDLFQVGVDSINVIQYILAVEDQFDVMLEDDDITRTNLVTLQAFGDLLNSKYLPKKS